MNLTLHVWRQKNASDSGKMGNIQGDGYQPGYVVSRDARCGK